MPEHDSIFVCSAYGCRTQTRFRFTPSDIATLENMMAPPHTKRPRMSGKLLGPRLLGWSDG